MSDYEWLQNLKVGDKVLNSNGRYGVDVVLTVRKITSAQIVVGKSRYWKKNGEVVGGTTSRWNTNRLIQATPERLEEIRAEQDLRRLINSIRDTKWRELTIDQLTRIEAIIKDANNANT